MTSHSQSAGRPGWRPALWLRSLAAISPARWPVGRSVRAGIGVTLPLLVGALAGNMVVGMWVSMGALLSATGERSTGYAARFRQLALSAPIAAAGFLLGPLGGAPGWLLVATMTAVSFAAGVLSGLSAWLSIATMQLLLLAAVSIGVDAAAPYWPAALLFLLGAALHALLMAVEAALDRRRPERDALLGVFRALSDLASSRARAAGPAIPQDRARSLAALDAFDAIMLAQRGRAQGPTRTFARAGAISRAADQLLARLLAHDVDRELCAATTRTAGCRHGSDPSTTSAPGA